MPNSTTDLGSQSIGKLLLKLATPSIIAQLVNVLYNIVDRIFIGRMQNGEVAMAGIGVAFPIVLLVSAFAAFIGMGGAPLAAIKMGEQDNDSAEKIMTNSFASLLIIALMLTIVFLIFREPILWKFGASESTIGYAMDYVGIYLIGTVFVQIALGMNPFINTQGFAKIGMMTVTIGAIINIVLDPILIFGFNMGVKGAAIATITAQAVSAIWVLRFLNSKNTILRLRKKYLKIDLKTMKPVFALGVAPFIMQSTESLVLVSLNSQLQKYGGDLAVGAMTIMSSIMQIILLPANGVTQGAQPIISYNFGAKNIDRVKKTFKYTVIATLSYTTFMCLILMIAPQVAVKIFNNDPALVDITSWSIKIYFAGIFMFGIQAACQSTLLALGQAKISLFLALLRKIILLVPLIFILPAILEDKLFAVFLAEPVADITAVLITSICFTMFYKKTLTNVKNIDNKFVGKEETSIN
ncbi:MAG: MATE family efflux transporter [Romboutsia sp.]|nr:MATE family efflux transporter [Romboutsia sp.]